MKTSGGRNGVHNEIGLALAVAGLCLLGARAFTQETSPLPGEPVHAVGRDISRAELMPDTAASRLGSDRSRVLPGSAAVPMNWEELRVGMTEGDVFTLLGVPSSQQKMSVLTYWFYDVGTAYIKPHVTFDDHKVYGWDAP